MPVRAMVWITDSNWRACVDAARAWIPEQAEITLLNVSDDEAADVVHGAFAGLLGRSHPTRDPSRQMKALDAAAAADLLDAAADRLGRSVTRLHRHGRVEHEVVHAVAGADLLLCARDGERNRLGPHSLSPTTRFVVDHAACAVLLTRPEPAPGVDTLPPPPPGRRPRP